jgi:hypothetical protein
MEVGQEEEALAARGDGIVLHRHPIADRPR